MNIFKATVTDEQKLFNKQLGLTFADPDKSLVKEFEEKITEAAKVLNKSAPQITLPSEGFLTKPLTLQQRLLLAQRYDKEYGKYFVNLQDSVRNVPIHETGEKMVKLEDLSKNSDVEVTYSTIPINAFAGDWAGKPRVYWAREQVANTFITVAKTLNQVGLIPHVEDGFRPIGVQEGIFQTVLNTIKSYHPEFMEEELLNETRSMVAIAPWIAGHKGGAALDYTLRSKKGDKLSLGHEYLELGAQVALEYPYVTWNEYVSRQLFATISSMSGFAVYPGEDWHISLGDTIASITSEHPDKFQTIYGPIKSFDYSTGEIVPYDPSDYYTNFSYKL